MSGRAEPPVRSIGTDPAAFTEFYRAHVDEVTRFVARRVADPQLVADVTAEVFVAVIETAARYRGSTGGPRTWLYGIARNVIAAEFRRSVRDQTTASRGKYGIWWIGDWQGIAGGAGAFHLVWNDTRTGKLDLFAATLKAVDEGN
jgi:DNA-directed RNA polymerase specialized sigma24 family protein